MNDNPLTPTLHVMHGAIRSARRAAARLRRAALATSLLNADQTSLTVIVK